MIRHEYKYVELEKVPSPGMDPESFAKSQLKIKSLNVTLHTRNGQQSCLFRPERVRNHACMRQEGVVTMLVDTKKG